MYMLWVNIKILFSGIPLDWIIVEGYCKWKIYINLSDWLGLINPYNFPLDNFHLQDASTIIQSLYIICTKTTNFVLWLARFNQRIVSLNQSLNDVSIYCLLKALESRVYIYVLELQIVSEMLRVNTGSSCVFPSRLLGSSAVFRIAMRATNESHCEGH
jgi:hypothetical protein